MIMTTGTTGLYDMLSEQRGRGRGPGAGWPAELREDAMERFLGLGLPSPRQEEWKHTNLEAALGEGLRLPETAGVRPESDVPFGDLNAARLVFVNGAFRPDLSDDVPDGIRHTPLAVAIRDRAPGLESRLACYADYRVHALAALNTALFTDGALIEVADGVVPARPVHVVHLAAATGVPVILSPRTLVVTGRNSRLRLVETWPRGRPGRRGLDSGGPGACWTNAVTEIVCGENAAVDHLKFLPEAGNSVHTATQVTWQEAASVFRTLTVTLGGRLVRNDTRSVLAGPGADCALGGLYLTAGAQHVDNHTVIDHAAGNTTSRELYKGILADRSSAVFDGAIVVRKDSQKSASSQQNRNLLLSDDAVIHTKPELRIFADDIRCTHGATIGQLDPDALFYLATRGIDPGAARQILTHAFVRDLIESVPVRELAGKCDREVREWLGRHVGAEGA